MREWDVYMVTDSSLTRRGIMEDAERAVAAGCMVVQYREKRLSTREMLGQARELKKICSGRADLIINDRVDICIAAGADGVHLGEDDLPVAEARTLFDGVLPGAIIGATVHSAKEAAEAMESGADYVGLSPIFATATKSDAGSPIGVEEISAVKAIAPIPVVAIGGINHGNLGEVIRAGADSAAMVSAIVVSKDVYRSVEDARRIITGARAQKITSASRR